MQLLTATLSHPRFGKRPGVFPFPRQQTTAKDPPMMAKIHRVLSHICQLAGAMREQGLRVRLPMDFLNE